MAHETHDESVRRLLRGAVRIPLEQRVSAHLGRVWRVETVQSKIDEASHPAAVLSDGRFAVFVKLGEGELAVDRFTQELAGLRLLTERSGVLTPPAIGILQVEGGVLVIMAAVQVVPRAASHWRQMGRTLAQIHRVKGDYFGLATHCYWGDLYQDNRPLPDWPEFYAARRLEPRLQAAVDSGHLPPSFVPRVETLCKRLPQLCGPPVQPALLHGDAHQNNFISTAQGPVLIDPAVYYGHPEMDLAYVDFFAPVPAELLDGYREIAPVDAGFEQRRDLWRIYAWLAMVQVDGARNLDKLDAALRPYA